MKHYADTSTSYHPATLLGLLGLTKKAADSLDDDFIPPPDMQSKAREIIELAERKLAEGEQRFAAEKLAMAQGKLAEIHPPETMQIAFETYSELLVASGQTIDRLVKKLNHDVTVEILSGWTSKRKLEFAELVRIVDRLADIFVPRNPDLAARAANIMIGLPPSQFKTFDGHYGVEGRSSAPG